MFLVITMFYLLACIISSTLIYVVFKVAKGFNSDLSTLISLNYLTAAILGFLYFPVASGNASLEMDWLPYSVILGILFIVMFYFIGHSSQKAGITITTLANKLSLVFPVLYSILFFKEQLVAVKILGLVLAFPALFLTVYKKDVRKGSLLIVYLPILIFFGSGLTDSVVKYVQAIQISPEEASTFSSFVFMISFVLSALILVFRKTSIKQFNLPTIVLGVLLGLSNFGSLFFMLEALNKSNMNSSLVFTVNNMSIVSLSAIIGAFFFNENITKTNLAGILLAILSLYLLF